MRAIRQVLVAYRHPPKGEMSECFWRYFILMATGEADGGQITVLNKQDDTVQPLSKLNRVVNFDSNLLHQMETANCRYFFYYNSTKAR